ncbi:MAG: hypothetical protein PHT90_05190 [Bacilli bacterium]|nr:hypothetical protein [Bacilli bacterium]
MKEYDANKLNIYLSERNKNYEIFIQGLSELHLKYDHSFAEYEKKNKNLKWLLLFFSSLIVAYLIMSWLSELPTELFFTFLAIFLGLILILFIFYSRNNNNYKADKNDFNYQYKKISVYLEEVEKYESLLKDEILQFIVLQKYNDEFLKLSEDDREKFVSQKKEIELDNIKKEVNGEINNREILNYFLSWRANISNSDSRDYRKERIDYLNRLDLEKEKKVSD